MNYDEYVDYYRMLINQLTRRNSPEISEKKVRDMRKMMHNSDNLLKKKAFEFVYNEMFNS